MSQICHNLQSLTIGIEDVISDGLADLISIQRNLKYLSIFDHSIGDNLAKIIPSIAKLPNNLTQLHINVEKNYSKKKYISLSFISKFTNLQVLSINTLWLY